jgi:pre-rRNA-processing protein TSR1
MFRKKGLSELDLISNGSLFSLDPKRILLKRILLTGYPHKINRRRATIRFMFFNPKDIKYYKPIDLFTRKGLRVRKNIKTIGNCNKAYWNTRVHKMLI